MRSRIGKTLRSGAAELLTCEEVIGFLHELLARELSAEEEREFRRHLAACPSCLAYLQTYEQAMKLAREALRREADAEPPQLSADLVGAILRARPSTADEGADS